MIPIKSKKKVSRFFSYMEDRYGKDWINKVSPVEMVNRADSFFKDLAYGGIDITLYGYAFDNYTFMVTMINESYYRYEIEFMEAHSLDIYGYFYPMRTQESIYNNLLTTHRNNYQAYAYINIKLREMMYTYGSEKLARIDMISKHLSSLRHSI